MSFIDVLRELFYKSQVNSIGCEGKISYASSSISDRENAHSTTEREELAIVAGTNHCQSYLKGRQCTSINDHSALCW